MIRVSITSSIKAYGVEIEVTKVADLVDLQALVDEGDAVILVADVELYEEFAEEHGLPDLEMLDKE